MFPGEGVSGLPAHGERCVGDVRGDRGHRQAVQHAPIDGSGAIARRNGDVVAESKLIVLGDEGHQVGDGPVWIYEVQTVEV